MKGPVEPSLSGEDHKVLALPERCRCSTTPLSWMGTGRRVQGRRALRSRSRRWTVLRGLLAAALLIALPASAPSFSAHGPVHGVARAQAVPVEIKVTIPQIVPFQFMDELLDEATTEGEHREELSGEGEQGGLGASGESFEENRDADATRFDTVGRVNAVIRQRALRAILSLAEVGNVWGGHEVHVDRPDLLSVTMDYSGYMAPMAHPVHWRVAVTANPKTGEVYSLSDLFVDERYLEVLSEAVRRRIEDQELPLLVEFEGIAPDQEFYLTHDSLVLYYQLYELVPYAWGFPEFAIPLYELEAIARRDGPIIRLLYEE